MKHIYAFKVSVTCLGSNKGIIDLERVFSFGNLEKLPDFYFDIFLYIIYLKCSTYAESESIWPIFDPINLPFNVKHSGFRKESVWSGGRGWWRGSRLLWVSWRGCVWWRWVGVGRWFKHVWRRWADISYRVHGRFSVRRLEIRSSYVHFFIVVLVLSFVIYRDDVNRRRVAALSRPGRCFSAFPCKMATQYPQQNTDTQHRNLNCKKINIHSSFIFTPSTSSHAVQVKQSPELQQTIYSLTDPFKAANSPRLQPVT